MLKTMRWFSIGLLIPCFACTIEVDAADDGVSGADVVADAVGDTAPRDMGSDDTGSRDVGAGDMGSGDMGHGDASADAGGEDATTSDAMGDGTDDGDAAFGDLANDAGNDAGDAASDVGDASADASADVGDADASACAEIAQGLAREMYATPQGCSAVVRLDHDSRDLLGFQLICGRYDGITSDEAADVAEEVTGYGTGTPLHGETSEDLYVFYESPGDFGGVGAVSTDTGLPVFGGSIVWDGAGDITYPARWRPVSGFADLSCDPSGGVSIRRGFDLVSGSALSSEDVDGALAVVERTPILAAFWSGGYVFDAVVLRYPRSVGAFDPSTAEWIVVISGGWLD